MSASAGTSFRYLARWLSSAGDMSAPRRRRFEVAPPLANALRLVVKAKERQQLELVALRSDGVRVELVETFECPHAFPRRRVRVAVHLSPFRAWSGQTEEAELLNKPVVAGAARNRPPDVLGEAPGLG